MKTFLSFIICFTAVVCSYGQLSPYYINTTLYNDLPTPHFLVTLDTLENAKVLKDIHSRFPADWIDQYRSVEIRSSCDGTKKKAFGTSDTLTASQIALFKEANSNCRIDVIVDYIPDNTLQYNPPRTMEFALTMIPIKQASFPGGRSDMDTYILHNTKNKISEQAFDDIERTVIRFKVDEEGDVFDTTILQSSDDAAIDQLLLQALCKMPRWQPALDAQGRALIQEFEFVFGSALLNGC